MSRENALYLSFTLFSTKVLNWRRDYHFTWSFEPREGPAACSAKGVPSFLRALSICQN